MSNLTPSQVAQIAYNAGFRGEALVYAVAVSLAEDGSGNPNANYTSSATGEDSRGLWQINVQPGAHPEYASSDLYDPATNAAAAYAISQGGTNWSPWSTWPGVAMGLIVQAANAVANAGIVVSGTGPQPITKALPPLPSLPSIAGIIPPPVDKAFSKMADAINTLVDSVATAANDVTTFVGDIRDITTFLQEPALWTRLVVGVLGALVLLLGLVAFGASLLPKGGLPKVVPV